jgi:nucleoside-diphosphate-sugar epimerase
MPYDTPQTHESQIMSRKRIFITGASGCVGHYVSAILSQQTDAELFLLVRDPEKLNLSAPADIAARITVLTGDMLTIETFADVLATIHVAILTATAWGGPDTYRVNLDKTHQLIRCLNPEICERVIYFSTASVIDRHQQPCPEAETLGTEYIRSKYLCLQQLPELPLASRVTTLFPTLVFGGDAHKPASQIAGGMTELRRWAWLARFLKGDGSFHFIHAQDIAQIVLHLVQHPEFAQGERLVMGQPEVSLNQLITAICAAEQQRIFWQLDLTPTLIAVLIKLFRVQMTPWDAFCLQQRHFGYAHPINPQTWGLTPYCESLPELLRVTQTDLAPLQV